MNEPTPGAKRAASRLLEQLRPALPDPGLDAWVARVIDHETAAPNLLEELVAIAELAASSMETTRMILQQRAKQEHDWTDEQIANWCNWGTLDTTRLRAALTKARRDEG